MKRKSALSKVKVLLTRLHGINGILSTPMHIQPFVKVKRVWLFGSVAKGSFEPNDIDLFVEVVYPELSFRDLPYYSDMRVDHLGKNINFIHGYRQGGIKWRNGGYKQNSQRFRQTGYCTALDAEETFVKWWRKNLQKVSVHFVGQDCTFYELDHKVLIYPRCDFDLEN